MEVLGRSSGRGSSWSGLTSFACVHKPEESPPREPLTCFGPFTLASCFKPVLASTSEALPRSLVVAHHGPAMPEFEKRPASPPSNQPQYDRLRAQYLSQRKAQDVTNIAGCVSTGSGSNATVKRRRKKDLGVWGTLRTSVVHHQIGTDSSFRVLLPALALTSFIRHLHQPPLTPLLCPLLLTCSETDHCKVLRPPVPSWQQSLRPWS